MASAIWWATSRMALPRGHRQPEQALPLATSNSSYSTR
jgi:hypothetical protein